MAGTVDQPAASLTGLWHGRYSYPSATRAPVPFVANLIETAEFIGGVITERGMLGPVKGRTLFATINGQRAGHAIGFRKIYEPQSGPYTQVAYEGVLSEDALEIDGDWIAAGWSGRFLMIRAPGLKTAARQQVEARV